MSISEIKKLLKTDKLVIGKDRILKGLKSGRLEKVFVSSNCSYTKDIEYYAKLGKVELSKLKMPNDELGVVCKKSFSISAIGVLKG